MDTLLVAHAKLKKQGGLLQATQDVDSILQLLESARQSIASDDHPDMSVVLDKTKSSVKQAFDKLNKDVKEAHNALGAYTKALEKTFKNINLPTASNDPFSARPDLTNRAITMHFLREGHFDVASTFIAESGASTGQTSKQHVDVDTPQRDVPMHNSPSDTATVPANNSDLDISDLQAKFSVMYTILAALRDHGDLHPAIEWARANREALNLRGSDLEFDLCRLRFVELYTGFRGDSRHDSMSTDHLARTSLALEYARATFPDLPTRYMRQVSSLLTSLAYAPSLYTSPYRAIFYNDDAWTSIANSFIREFCGLLGLSEQSPLYTAVTAGGIALPVLEKLERKMGQVGGQWTSANELPVEIALPPTFQFHSIFVCPVSKEQGTDANPPMMMPCCHVIAKESLEKISRQSKRFKCPYCPNESNPHDAKAVYL